MQPLHDGNNQYMLKEILFIFLAGKWSMFSYMHC